MSRTNAARATRLWSFGVSRVYRWFVRFTPRRFIRLVLAVADVKPRGRPPGRLHAAAKKARAEAEAHLGADFPRFSAAVERYVNAVEVADAARQEWERLQRPMTSVGSQGQEVEHPFLRTMERLDRSAAAFGALLGLDPKSARQLAGVGTRGRPVGAVSAADRKAEAPKLKLAQ